MKLTILFASIAAFSSLPAAAYTQYHQPQFFHSAGAAPVVVPPTVINTQQANPNDSKKSCRESMVDLFLFSIRRTTGDCTP